jgi:hypothetical protein
MKKKLQERSEQGFAANPSVMHELKEAEIQWQLFLGDAPMGSQPGTQQRPEPFDGIDVNLVKAVTVVIARILLPLAVADAVVLVTPVAQAGIEVILVGIHLRTRSNGRLNQ